MSPVQTPLSSADRGLLERTVLKARKAAETAAESAVTLLGVAEAKVPEHLSEPQRLLRRRLRALARTLGDILAPNASGSLSHLVAVVAYEHWHRMLFARFLAENGLLLWEPGVPVTLAECDELAQDVTINMGARSGWDLAGKLAARMLPQIFKADSPIFDLAFAPEHQRELETLLAALPPNVFLASDSLGWVYQFWQTQRKVDINKSEVKIGAYELPAVTQLFTEPYMVDFLLHNSLGAWWQTRHPHTPSPVSLPYLRLLDDGTPAAGSYPDWPDHLSEFKLLDPCCGSGHFLVAAFSLLVPMRMVAEGLRAAEAVDAVLTQNLHGLELDPRCVEIAVFALALMAWRFPDDHGRPLGVRPEMPSPRVACCGLPVTASPADWENLVPQGTDPGSLRRAALRQFHATFSQAPLLGSLLAPNRDHRGNLFAADYASLRAVVQQALAAERPDVADEAWGVAVSAQGLMDAAAILDDRYHLVITNVPYLSRGKQSEALRDYCAKHYADAKNDLANVFLERCLELALPAAGLVQIVMPQNWLFLAAYRKQREHLLRTTRWNLLARLGAGAFETISGEVVKAILVTLTNEASNSSSVMSGIDASPFRQAPEKAKALQEAPLSSITQYSSLKNPLSVVALTELNSGYLLQDLAEASHGQGTFDSARFSMCFWEPKTLYSHWELQQSAPTVTGLFGGCHYVFRWENGTGGLAQMMEEKQKFGYSSGKWKAGVSLWGKMGVMVGQIGSLPSAMYLGRAFDDNAAAIIPIDRVNLAAVWSYCSSSDFNTSVREINQKLNVTVSTLVKVPFDLAYWQAVANQKYPNGLPKPFTNFPTEWLFHGHPCGSVVWQEAVLLPDGTNAGGELCHGALRTDATALQVAVARLLGYTWPAESDPDLELAEEARLWIERCTALAHHVDDDGIVCLQPVRGEKPAHERLLSLLIDAWETIESGSWKPGLLDKLLNEADYGGKGLAVWLRDGFFEQHTKLFHHRPFIWHVWDGLKDGFGALVNYHKLDEKNLKRLIYTYLDDWIGQQQQGSDSGVDGAEQRLAAAKDLKRRLELILAGEAPYDIFVRWKALNAQPIGWNPDHNDGVRLNIRPFVTAGVLRHNKKPKLNIHWEKDRGKDVASAPWYETFQGDRINDHHLTMAEKRAAKGQV